MRALVHPSATVGSVTPASSFLSIALPKPADACYALFCDAERIPEWLSVVRSVVVTSRDHRGRARDVAFLARLQRATLGYTCRYRYDASDRHVSWATPSDATILIQGFSQFAPLGERACLMTYSLDLDLGEEGALPAWSDPFFEGHAASSTMHDFRDFAIRVL